METKSPSAAGRSTPVQRGEPLAQAVELLVDVVVGDLGVVDGDLEAVVVRQVELGPDVDLGGELQVAAPSSNSVTSTSGWPSTLRSLLSDGLAVELRQRLVDRLLQHDAPAEPLVDDAAAAPCPCGSRGRSPGWRSSCTPRRGSVLSSSNGTSTVSLTRVGFRVSTSLFTAGVSSWITGWGIADVRLDGQRVRGSRSGRRAGHDVTWSGRGDSNSRSPAPKAGALATTLRPAALWQPRADACQGLTGACAGPLHRGTRV